MSKYTSFEELPVWREAARLYNCVLDLLEEPRLPLSSGFRNQLDRASLSISNNIAEGFERITTRELLSFLTIARGSAGEVRSMLTVVLDRPKLTPHVAQLRHLRTLAQSCSKQLSAWATALEESNIQGKRRLFGKEREAREATDKAKAFRTNFLRTLSPQHPLYNSPEAREARGESESAGL